MPRGATDDVGDPTGLGCGALGGALPLHLGSALMFEMQKSNGTVA